MELGEFKKGDETDEKRIDEITKVIQDADVFGERPDYSFYDELPEQREKIMSDDPESIVESLNWFADMLHLHPFQVENEILDKMIQEK